MTEVVVDCSAVVPWFFPEEKCGPATALFEDARRGRLVCLAPSLLQAEFCNVVWKKIRRNQCGLSSAAMQLELFQKAGIYCFEIKHLLPEALVLARRHEITVYDALYLALAQYAKASLATLDEALRKRARDAGVALYE
jgi:predicted nucleic acid-binding protein